MKKLEPGLYLIRIKGKRYDIWKGKDGKWRVESYQWNAGQKFPTLKSAHDFVKKHANQLKEKKTTTSKAGVKANGKLKKGYRYAKGGRVVKAKK